VENLVVEDVVAADVDVVEEAERTLVVAEETAAKDVMTVTAAKDVMTATGETNVMIETVESAFKMTNENHSVEAERAMTKLNHLIQISSTELLVRRRSGLTLPRTTSPLIMEETGATNALPRIRSAIIIPSFARKLPTEKLRKNSLTVLAMKLIVSQIYIAQCKEAKSSQLSESI
jgi:hypothetical protein